MSDFVQCPGETNDLFKIMIGLALGLIIGWLHRLSKDISKKERDGQDS